MVRGKPHSAQTSALRPLARVRGQISVIGSGVSARESGGSLYRSNRYRYSVALATRLIDRVTVPPPHGAWQASQCSNIRIAVTHTRPWSNIRDRIGRLCARVWGGSLYRSNRYSVALATRLIDRVTVPPLQGAGQASQCSNTRIAATHMRP
jgi:hypothetical protein